VDSAARESTATLVKTENVEKRRSNFRPLFLRQ
jgi:hypothetical protein